MKVKTTLMEWNKLVCGKFFDKMATLEDMIRVKEILTQN